jgi:hypothetical protein
MPKLTRQKCLAALQRKMPPITDKHGTRRLIALLFGFCGRCENRHCRRADKCVGEDASCFKAFWPAVPEIEKDLFREMVKARIAGARTAAEIEAVAIGKVMAHYKMAEKFAAPEHGPPEKPLREPILPRARIL